MKKENKKAYLLAVGMGIGASVSMVAVKGIDNILVNYNPSSYNFFLLFDSIFPISILSEVHNNTNMLYTTKSTQ